MSQNFIEQFRRPQNDIEMAIGQGIETSRIDYRAHNVAES